MVWPRYGHDWAYKWPRYGHTYNGHDTRCKVQIATRCNGELFLVNINFSSNDCRLLYQQGRITSLLDYYLFSNILHVMKSGRIVAIKYGRIVGVWWPYGCRIVAISWPFTGCIVAVWQPYLIFPFPYFLTQVSEVYVLCLPKANCLQYYSIPLANQPSKPNKDFQATAVSSG